MSFGEFGRNFAGGIQAGVELGRAVNQGRDRNAFTESGDIWAEAQEFARDPLSGQKRGAIGDPEGGTENLARGSDGNTWQSYKDRYMKSISGIGDPQMFEQAMDRFAGMEQEQILSRLDNAIMASKSGDPEGARRQLQAMSAFMDPGVTPEIQYDGQNGAFMVANYDENNSPISGYAVTTDNLMDLRHRMSDFNHYREFSFDRQRHQDVLSERAQERAFNQAHVNRQWALTKAETQRSWDQQDREWEQGRFQRDMEVVITAGDLWRETGVEIPFAQFLETPEIQEMFQESRAEHGPPPGDVNTRGGDRGLSFEGQHGAGGGGDGSYGESAFGRSLIHNESGGNWQASNDVMGSGGRGHFGRLQFSQGRLQDAANAGVIPQGVSPQEFMSSEALQRRVEDWHFNDIDNNIRRNGLDRYEGQVINGTEVTRSGMHAAAHLGGFGGLKRHLESGGQYNPADANGTRLSDYMRNHGGLEIRGTSTMDGRPSPADRAPQGPVDPNVGFNPEMMARQPGSQPGGAPQDAGPSQPPMTPVEAGAPQREQPGGVPTLDTGAGVPQGGMQGDTQGSAAPGGESQLYGGLRQKRQQEAMRAELEEMQGNLGEKARDRVSTLLDPEGGRNSILDNFMQPVEAEDGAGAIAAGMVDGAQMEFQSEALKEFWTNPAVMAAGENLMLGLIAADPNVPDSVLQAAVMEYLGPVPNPDTNLRQVEEGGGHLMALDFDGVSYPVYSRYGMPAMSHMMRRQAAETMRQEGQAAATSSGPPSDEQAAAEAGAAEPAGAPAQRPAASPGGLPLPQAEGGLQPGPGASEAAPAGGNTESPGAASRGGSRELREALDSDDPDVTALREMSRANDATKRGEQFRSWLGDVAVRHGDNIDAALAGIQAGNHYMAAAKAKALSSSVDFLSGVTGIDLNKGGWVDQLDRIAISHLNTAGTFAVEGFMGTVSQKAAPLLRQGPPDAPRRDEPFPPSRAPRSTADQMRSGLARQRTEPSMR